VSVANLERIHDDKRLFGHPVGLGVLFMTEMWERFSYYGMRSLLVLYMVNHLLANPEAASNVLGLDLLRSVLESVFGPMAAQPFASQIYGLYTGLVYLTPFFGGLLADQLLGQRRSVVLGALLMAFGHFLMALESMFLLALFFLILGNGAFKPNISTQVGGLYRPGDSRRDGAYTIFYMGINLGAFLSPLVCGTLGQKMGWHWGFGAAGVGMLIGLVIYLAGQKTLVPDRIQARAGAPRVSQPLSRDEWLGIAALGVLCALNVVFWGVYEQQGNTMQLWADEKADWNVLGWQMPSTWYQSFNPFMIFLFAPLLDGFWRWQRARGQEPSTVTKMGMGCILLGLCFLIMIAATKTVPDGQRGTVMWLVATTFVLTIGELYLSPIGLSLVSKVAPARLVSMLMGMWFLSSFFGNYLSGFLGTYWETMAKESFFGMLTILGVGAGVIMLVLSRPLERILARQQAANEQGATP
jgi:POT family proton-dependent oligopeptide transporter